MRRYYYPKELPGIGLPQSNQTLLRWEREDKFPRRVTLPSGRVAWVAEEVDAWLDRLASNREQPVLHPGIDKINSNRQAKAKADPEAAHREGAGQSSQE